MEMASQVTYNLLITSARLSVLLLFRRIFSLAKRSFRIAWWSCTALTLAYCVALLGSFLAQCYGVSSDPGTCRNSESAATKAPIIVGFLNIGIDLSIWILPVRMVWMLQLNVRRKVGVCAMFALGLMWVLQHPFS